MGKTLHTRMKKWVVGFYELDQSFGGHEEGGWWYTTGNLKRVFASADTQDEARAIVRKANGLLDRLQKDMPHLSSMRYAGGRYTAKAYENVAPSHFPEERPHYE